MDVLSIFIFFFFFKQKTAYEMRISDWSSDVCSSDLHRKPDADHQQAEQYQQPASIDSLADLRSYARANHAGRRKNDRAGPFDHARAGMTGKARGGIGPVYRIRSEEHTSELQSLMRISYTVFCL